jgi:hypothetical protein
MSEAPPPPAVGGILRVVAPTMAAANAGPFASHVQAALHSALGLPPDADAQAVAVALSSATGGQLLALKQAETEFAGLMRSLGIDVSQVRTRASDNAPSAPPHHNNAAKVMALGISAAFFGMIFLLSFHSMPTENREIVLSLIGILGTTFVGTASYFFGNNVGSHAKDVLLAAATPPAESPPRR